MSPRMCGGGSMSSEYNRHMEHNHLSPGNISGQNNKMNRHMEHNHLSPGNISGTKEQNKQAYGTQSP